MDKADKDNPRYLRRMLIAALAAHSPRVLCYAYRAQGFYYRTTGDYYQGLQSFFQQLRTARQAGLADEITDALGAIGDTYNNVADYQQSLACYQ